MVGEFLSFVLIMMCFLLSFLILTFLAMFQNKLQLLHHMCLTANE